MSALGVELKLDELALSFIAFVANILLIRRRSSRKIEPTFYRNHRNSSAANGQLCNQTAIDNSTIDYRCAHCHLHVSGKLGWFISGEFCRISSIEENKTSTTDRGARTKCKWSQLTYNYAMITVPTAVSFASHSARDPENADQLNAPF